MIKRILVWVNEGNGSREVVKWAITLAKLLNAQVLAVYILPEEEKRRKRRGPTEREEKAWEVLYEVEDEAFEQEVRISLLMETGDPLQRIRELCSSYKTDLLVINASCSIPPSELIRHSAPPVVFITTQSSRQIEDGEEKDILPWGMGNKS